MLCGKPPSREIAAVALLPRKDSITSDAIVRWDISLTLNMTYFFILRHSERSEESHRRTDGHIPFTSVVGYFANAQYDVLFYFTSF